MANPPDQVQRHVLESSVVLVDNTPPRFVELALRRLVPQRDQPPEDPSRSLMRRAVHARDAPTAGRARL